MGQFFYIYNKKNVKKTDDLPQDYQLILQHIGKTLRIMRKSHNKSYVTMAEEIGLHKNSYNQIELGKLNFQFSTLLQILKYHNTSVYDFFKEVKKSSQQNPEK